MADDAYEQTRAEILALPPDTHELDLSFRNLATIPPEIARFAALQSLFLDGNQLTALPPEITRLTALQVLSLPRNQLTALPPEIAGLTALQVLSLANNRLTSLPSEIASFTALRYLSLDGNQLTALPPEITRLTALESLYLNRNQLTALPPEIARLTALQYLDLGGNRLASLPSEITRLTALESLHLERNPLPTPYPALIAPGQPAATRNVLAYLRGELPDRLEWKEPREAIQPPPDVPPQGLGPHVEINEAGVIVPVPAGGLDSAGNNIPRLRSLHPGLRELARALAASLGSGNAPHATLGERVAAYAAIIDQPLETMDFAALYLAGVRLANAAHAARHAINKGDLPAVDAPDDERLSSLLDLHGPFILATCAGAEALDDEHRYKRRPAEERQYRADAVAALESLQNRPDLLDPQLAENALGAAREMGQGTHPERSAVAGRGIVRNILIATTSSALTAGVILIPGTIAWGVGGALALVTTLAVNETLKRTNWFLSIVENGAGWINNRTDPATKAAAEKLQAGLQRHADYVRENEPALRKLAGNREEFSFLHRALDWLKQHGQTKP